MEKYSEVFNDSGRSFKDKTIKKGANCKTPKLSDGIRVVWT